jgi:hypothetical protein
MQTWMRLVANPVKVRGAAAGNSASTVISPPRVTPAASLSVADWPLTRRFEEVLKLTPKHLKPEAAALFRAMLTPLNLSIAVGTLAVWAVSHAFGAGEAADVVLGAIGVVFLGLGAFTAGHDIGDCLMITLYAKDHSDLDKAAALLAQAIDIIGVMAFFSLLAKVGAKLKGIGGVADEEAGVGAGKTAGNAGTKLQSDAPAPESDLSRTPPEEPELAGRSTLQQRQAFRQLFGQERYSDYAAKIDAMRPGHPELNGIPTEDLVAIKGYTSADFATLNPALRSGDPAELARLDPYVQCAKSGLDQLPSYDGIVVRGTTLTASEAAKYIPGEIVQEPAFTSSSWDPNAAFSGNTEFNIASVNGKAVSFLSDSPAEKEILFTPGTKFEVLDNVANPDTGIREIYMREVP